MYEAKQLSPEELAEIMKKVNQDKYRKKLLDAATAIDSGMMIEIPPDEFTELYSSLATLRVWVSKLNKKYSDRRYVVLTDDSTGNVCLCRTE